MIGQVVVMEPNEFQRWLASGEAEGSLASEGGKLFADLACNTCHRPDAQGRAPVLEGLFGKTVRLEGGGTALVDEAYLREAIVNPAAGSAWGSSHHATYQGVGNEEGLLALIEYVKSLQNRPQAPPVRPERNGPARGENTPARGAVNR